MNSILNKYNKGSKFTFVPGANMEYKKLEDLEPGKVYQVKALYINTKGKFGESGVVATDEFFINLPSHMTETVKEMLKDDELIQLINNGGVGLTTYTYHSNKYNKDCYGANWVDYEPGNIPF